MSGLRDLLSIRDFRLLWSAQAISNTGDALTNLALLLTAQRLTGSTAAVAGTAIALALPQLLFGLVAGAYVDRWDRRRVMIATDLARSAVVLGFLGVASADLMWLLYVLAFAQASLGAFFAPARMAIIPLVVGPDRLLAANSVGQTTRVVFGLAGTGLAGLIAASGSLAPAFIADAASFVVSATLLLGIRTPTRAERDPADPGSVIDDVREGLGVIVGSRPLLAAMLGGATVMLGLGAVNVLLVPFIVEVLAISEAWFGAVEGAQVAGMVLAGGVTATLAARLRSGTILSGGLVGIGGAVAALAAVTAPWQLLVVLFAAGLATTPTQAAMTTIVQEGAPDRLRGRVSSGLNTAITAAQVASMAAAGAAAGALGVRGVFLAGGALAVAAGLVVAALLRATPVSRDVSGSEPDPLTS